jgi:hypothetical protein
MATDYWFNRMVEYWSIPLNLDLPGHVRKAGLQLVQAGTFGPQFYSLADDPSVDRHWVGMPLVGVRENLTYARQVIAGVQAAGARFVGQMSMSWNYGDHETGKGLFGVWEQLWTGDLLGPAPAAGAGEMMERVPGGALRCWPIEGRPYRTYSGCFCNPAWLAALKAMLGKAIGLGVDGMMVHHNFSFFCRCDHCRTYLLPRLEGLFGRAELERLFGTAEGAAVGDPLSPLPSCPPELKQRFDLELNRLVHRRRKEAFDEIYIDFGRGLKPDLLLAQWYHKYDFGPGDERNLLPAGLWGRDESYIWYSQGPYKGLSAIARGYLADTGLAARFIHAAGGGRPFICNKYDYRRLRLSIGEAAAHGCASLAFHLPGGADDPAGFVREEYYGSVVRYHRFIAERQSLYHPAQPWSQLALVYPRRGELENEGDCLDALKRLGRLLEDGHLLFDLLLDEQLVEQGGRYAALILPEVKRLAAAEWAWLQHFAAAGGRLVMTRQTGGWQPDGRPWPQAPAAAWPEALRERVLWLPEVSWAAEEAEVREGMRVRVYPPLDRDPFGRDFLRDLEILLGRSSLQTDAPWSVRVRAWRPESPRAVVLHWVNYHQDEESAVEIPFPVGPVQVECAVPRGERVARVEWLYPEMREPVVLPHDTAAGRVRFAIPRLIVYGLSVVHLEAE